MNKLFYQIKSTSHCLTPSKCSETKSVLPLILSLFYFSHRRNKPLQKPNIIPDKFIVMYISHFPLIVLLSIIVLSSADAQIVITSPGICLRDSDCNEFSEYCGTNYQCYKRGGKNNACSGNVECSDGLYCGEVNDRRVCVPQSALFEKCDYSFEGSCAVEGRFTYKCSPVTKTCQYTGFDGATCFKTDDCQIGSYCKDSGNINGGKCSPKLKHGEKCGGTGDSGECDGFCAFGSVGDFDGGVCVFGSTVGEPCILNSDCQGYETSLNDPNSRGISRISCNIAKGNIGICEHERELIKKEGIRCNPARDICDAERGLSCRRTSSGPKCMFNRFDSDIGGPRFCDINGNLSKCNLRNGVPTECRRNFDDGSPFGNEYKQFFQCLQKKEIVPHGLPCNDVAFSVCEKGTMCMVVPGVERQYFKFARPAKFCVQLKKKGEKCYSKFRFACDDGLKCENNVCVNGKPDETITHGYERVECDKQPCAPGLECVQDLEFRSSSCKFKQIQKNTGGCYRTALTETVSNFPSIHIFSFSHPTVLFTNMS